MSVNARLKFSSNSWKQGARAHVARSPRMRIWHVGRECLAESTRRVKLSFESEQI